MPPSKLNLQFELYAVEQVDFEHWVAIHAKNCRMGSGLAYTFTPSGIGRKVAVVCQRCNEEKDITDYDNW